MAKQRDPDMFNSSRVGYVQGLPFSKPLERPETVGNCEKLQASSVSQVTGQVMARESSDNFIFHFLTITNSWLPV